MTAILANGYPVIEGAISAPRSGAWWAEIQTVAPLVTGDTVVISDGTTELRGYVASGGGAVSRTVARIIGGKGGLLGTMPARHWRDATVGKILGNICTDLGETKSNAIDPSISGAVFPFWSQPSEAGGSALSNLSDSGDWVWRVLQSGNVWLGVDSQGELEPDYTILEPHPEDSSYDVAPESLSLWVGKLQRGSVVKRVEYSLGENLRCTYWV